MTPLSRRSVILGSGAIAAGTLPGGRPVRAAAGPARILILTPRANIGDVLGFRDYMASSGLDARIEVRTVEKVEDVATLLPAIKADRPDLVVTVFTPLTLATVGRYDDPDPGRFIGDIPVVFTSVTNPVASGIVPPEGRGGRQITGTRHIAQPETQINTLMAYRKWKKLCVLYNPAEYYLTVELQTLKAEAARQGAVIVEKPLPRSGDGTPDPSAIPTLIAEAAEAGAELVYIGPDTVVASDNHEQVAQAALKHRLCSFCATELPIRRSRLLMGLVSPAANVGRFAALKASQILTGARRADAIPIETLERFSLIIRIGVARELEMFPPMRLLNISEIIDDG